MTLKIQYESFGIIIKLMVFRANGAEPRISHHRFACRCRKAAVTGCSSSRLFECILGSAVLDRERANVELCRSLCTKR